MYLYLIFNIRIIINYNTRKHKSKSLINLRSQYEITAQLEEYNIKTYPQVCQALPLILKLFLSVHRKETAVACLQIPFGHTAYNIYLKCILSGTILSELLVEISHFSLRTPLLSWLICRIGSYCFL